MCTSDGNMEVSQEKSDGPPWSELPTLVTEKVYSFLNRRDQNSMSLVCRNWREQYNCPSLWRKMKFCFPDVESKALLCPEVVFAWRYGSMFHHVEIVFSGAAKPPFPFTHNTISKQLTLFTRAVTRHSQLLSISLKNMIFYLQNVDEATAAEVYRTVLDLLKSQKTLQRVEFPNCEFKHAAAAEILNAIFLNNSRTLRCLRFNGISEDPLNTFAENTVDQDLNFAVLMNLEVLEMNYTRMFENMMASFYEYRNKVDMRDRKGCLKEIILLCNGFSRVNYLTIHPIVWQYFKEIFPDLRLELLISLNNSATFAKFIVPHMPFKALSIILISFFLENLAFGSLLRHITSCEINKSLEMLKIVCQRSSSDLSTSLLSFTSISPKLKTLELVTGHPVTALETVFNSWLENRPTSLDVVKITIVHVHREEEKTDYAHFKDVYAPLLQSVGISLRLLVQDC